MKTQTSQGVASTPANLAKFLPGLVLGVTVGSFSTAFVAPIAQYWMTRPTPLQTTAPYAARPITTTGVQTAQASPTHEGR